MTDQNELVGRKVKTVKAFFLWKIFCGYNYVSSFLRL